VTDTARPEWYPEAAREVTNYLIQNLSDLLPRNFALNSDGSDITVVHGQDRIQAMDIALVDPPEDLNEYSDLLQIALDNIQTVISRLTTEPWPQDRDRLTPSNAYVSVRDGLIFSGYATAHESLIALPPFTPGGPGRVARRASP